MSVSVVISNLNGARFLPRLLKTLEAQRGVELEIIVVDRHSRDESAAILQRHPQVVVVSEPPETGLVSGYHRGARVAKGEHLFFINEDMWFDPDCLRRLEGQIDLDRRIAAADPWQWTYDGAQWIHGGTRFHPARWAINGVYPFRAIDFTVDLPEGSQVPFGCAGAVMIHRRVYEELGGWDTSFFLDNEDVDFFLRAWQRGWRCVSVPGARVYHAVGMSNPGASLEAPRKAGVSKRRYVANRYGVSVIIAKLFSVPHALWMAPAVWLVMFANNVLKLRWKLAGWDLSVFGKCLGHLPDVLAFRRANRAWNRQRPGERFFLQPEFARGHSGSEP